MSNIDEHIKLYEHMAKIAQQRINWVQNDLAIMKATREAAPFRGWSAALCNQVINAEANFYRDALWYHDYKMPVILQYVNEQISWGATRRVDGWSDARDRVSEEISRVVELKSLARRADRDPEGWLTQRIAMREATLARLEVWAIGRKGRRILRSMTATFEREASILRGILAGQNPS